MAQMMKKEGRTRKIRVIPRYKGKVLCVTNVAQRKTNATIRTMIVPASVRPMATRYGEVESALAKLRKKDSVVILLPEPGLKIAARTAIRAWLKLRNMPAKLSRKGKTGILVRWGEFDD